MSVKRLEIANIKVTFKHGYVGLYKDRELIGLGERNNLYEICFYVIKNESLLLETENEVTNL